MKLKNNEFYLLVPDLLRVNFEELDIKDLAELYFNIKRDNPYHDMDGSLKDVRSKIKGFLFNAFYNQYLFAQSIDLRFTMKERSTIEHEVSGMINNKAYSGQILPGYTTIQNMVIKKFQDKIRHKGLNPPMNWLLVEPFKKIVDDFRDESNAYNGHDMFPGPTGNMRSRPFMKLKIELPQADDSKFLEEFIDTTLILVKAISKLQSMDIVKVIIQLDPESDENFMYDFHVKGCKEKIKKLLDLFDVLITDELIQKILDEELVQPGYKLSPVEKANVNYHKNGD